MTPLEMIEALAPKFESLRLCWHEPACTEYHGAHDFKNVDWFRFMEEAEEKLDLAAITFLKQTCADGSSYWICDLAEAGEQGDTIRLALLAAVYRAMEDRGGVAMRSP